MGQRIVGALTSRLGSLIVIVLAIAFATLAFATSPAQPTATPTDGLPAGKQSTRVTELADRFPSTRASAAVIVYERADGPLTKGDRAAIDTARRDLGPKALGGQVPAAATSTDGHAALLSVPLAGDLSADDLNTLVDTIRSDARAAGTDTLPAGLTAQVTGPAAIQRDIAKAFDGADVTLLGVTAAVVALMLIVTYRSPVLWVVPLLVIGIGDQVAAQLLPWVAKLVGERTDASVSGIVTVLVFGAGTDYALLLMARYREELRLHESRRDAMARALRSAGPAVLASATTVVLALLTLTTAVLTSNRTLGIAGALGIVVALIFELVVLPAVLVCFGRWLFWPFVPRVGSPDPHETGLWANIAALVGRRPGRVFAVNVVILGALSVGLVSAQVGLSQTEQFRTKVEAVTAQNRLARHFPAGLSEPATVIVDTTAATAATDISRATSGVAEVVRPELSDDKTLTKLTVDLADGAGTKAADRTVTDLRTRLAAVPDANALVGGAPASDLDRRAANVRDAKVVVPLVLAVVLIIMIVLLRSLVAPLLLVATVVTTYAAALGAATQIFRHLIGIDALADSVPLLAFLFLVALSVDYNIFLATRAREETIAQGSTRDGMLRALRVTGGVITSAGILLAAVFAVLGVLPVIALTQIGVIVGLGVVVDTLLVRTLLVPALAMLLGGRFWWPAHPADGADIADRADTSRSAGIAWTAG